MLQLFHDYSQELCLYYECVLALPLALAKVINYAPRVIFQIVASLRLL